LEFNGRDEFSEVADNINKMLVGISKSQESLRESDNALQKEKEALNKKVLELERFNQLTIGRELKMIELKKEIEQLKNGGV